MITATKTRRGLSLLLALVLLAGMLPTAALAADETVEPPVTEEPALQEEPTPTPENEDGDIEETEPAAPPETEGTGEPGTPAEPEGTESEATPEPESPPDLPQAENGGEEPGFEGGMTPTPAPDPSETPEPGETTEPTETPEPSEAPDIMEFIFTATSFNPLNHGMVKETPVKQEGNDTYNLPIPIGAVYAQDSKLTISAPEGTTFSVQYTKFESQEGTESKQESTDNTLELTDYYFSQSGTPEDLYFTHSIDFIVNETTYTLILKPYVELVSLTVGTFDSKPPYGFSYVLGENDGIQYNGENKYTLEVESGTQFDISFLAFNTNGDVGNLKISCPNLSDLQNKLSNQIVDSSHPEYVLQWQLDGGLSDAIKQKVDFPTYTLTIKLNTAAKYYPYMTEEDQAKLNAITSVKQGEKFEIDLKDFIQNVEGKEDAPGECTTTYQWKVDVKDIEENGSILSVPTEQLRSFKFSCTVTNTIEEKTYPYEVPSITVWITPTGDVLDYTPEFSDLYGLDKTGEKPEEQLNELVLPMGKKEDNFSVNVEMNNYVGFYSYTQEWFVNNNDFNTGGELLEEERWDDPNVYASTLHVKPRTNLIGTYWYYCEVTFVYKYKENGEWKQISSKPTASKTFKVTVTKPEFDMEGSGTAEDPFQIAEYTDLVALSNQVNSGFAFNGTYFRITDDITLEGDWTPLGCLKSGEEYHANGENIWPFSGIIDGGGHTLSFTGTQPLLGFARDATLSNIKIYGSWFSGNGILQNYVVDTKGSCTLRLNGVTILSGTKIYASGITGGTPGLAGGSTNNIIAANCVIEKGVKIGVNADGSSANGVATSTFGESHSTLATVVSIGSFLGEAQGELINCVSYADVYGRDKVGGLWGKKAQSMSRFNIQNCQFHGNVYATGNYVGGIVGCGYVADTAPNCPGLHVTGCTVTGNVTGGSCVGGIAGGDPGIDQHWPGGMRITGNRFSGTVSGSENVGGIIGYVRSLNRNSVIENNYYASGSRAIGGVLHIDTSAVPFGMRDGVMYYSTDLNTWNNYTKEQIDQIWAVVDSGWDSRWKELSIDKNHMNSQRDDDPLGADADNLGYTGEFQGDRVSTVEISGTYKTDYLVGEALDLTGAVVTVTLADGTSKTVDWRELTVSGYDPNTPGEQVVTLTYNGPKNSASTTITVKVTPKSSKITVTVSILGDSAHGEGGAVHTLSGGGLQTWAAATQYDADTAWTVWDVLQKAFTANNITPQTSAKMGTVYIEALTRNGVTLAEFDNGPNSGWMYTINGHHSLLGVSQQYLHDKDNIVLHYSDDYTLEEGSSDFEDADDAVKKVKDLIDAIGDNVTLDSKDKIEAARKAYNALTYAQKQQVSNYGKLQAAEAKLRELQAEADKTAAKAVEDQIDALPSPAGEADREAVAAARKAYDALTDAQKKLVKNYQKLVEAQRDIALLDATPEDIEAADAVQKLIDALPEPVKTEDKAAVEAARKAYDALTDLQKLLVTNLTKLEAAEERLSLLDALKPSLDIYAAAGEFIESLRDLTEEADLYALGMARSGHEVSGKFYEAVEDYVAEYIDESGRLHRSRSEDNSRTILVLTVLGRDVTDVGGHNLLLGLSDMEYLKKQGVTGPAWALIALDSHGYEIPENPEAEEQASREKIVEYLMEEANEDGGWSISGKLSEAETTAVVLTALAGYYPEDEEDGEAPDEAAEKLKAVVDKGVQTLSDMQDEDGGYSALAKDGTTMEPNSESAAAVLTALSALNIDGHTDERFVKNGKSVIDALCEYSVEGGGFSATKEGERSEGATEVAYTALTAYLRMLEGETALYDMSDVEIEAPAAEAKPLTALTEPEPTEAAPEVPETMQPPEAQEEEKPSLWDRIVGWFR